MKSYQDSTLPQIQKIFEDKAKFNPGLYHRSQLMSVSRERSIVTITPLRFLQPFWTLSAFLPMRQTISMDLSLNDDKAIFVLKDGVSAATKYKLTVVKSNLRLFYGVFLPNLKERWLNSISTLGLRRNLQVTKNNYIVVPTGSQSIRMTNCFSFGLLPATVVLFFTRSSCEFGNWSDTKFKYENVDLTAIKLFKSGQPLEFNKQLSDLKVTEKNSEDHIFLYHQFVQTFGPKAAHESLDSFFQDMFLYCVPLCRNPRLGNDYGVVDDPADRVLSFGEASTLDIDIVFKTPTTQEYLFHCNGLFDIFVSFDSFGQVLQD